MANWYIFVYFLLFKIKLTSLTDPFGASSVTPTLNKLSGFDAHIIDRVTYKVNFKNIIYKNNLISQFLYIYNIYNIIIYN